MSRPLQIAILGTRGIPNAYGGFEQFAEHVSVELTNRGHSVTVYCGSRHPYLEPKWRNVHLVHCEDTGSETFGQFKYDLACINHARKPNL